MANRINTQIAKDFENLQSKILSICEAYNINVSGIILELSEAKIMSRKTFYKKIKQKSFTASEIIKISQIINR